MRYMCVTRVLHVRYTCSPSAQVDDGRVDAAHVSMPMMMAELTVAEPTVPESISIVAPGRPNRTSWPARQGTRRPHVGVVMTAGSGWLGRWQLQWGSQQRSRLTRACRLGVGLGMAWAAWRLGWWLVAKCALPEV